MTIPNESSSGALRDLILPCILSRKKFADSMSRFRFSKASSPRRSLSLASLSVLVLFFAIAPAKAQVDETLVTETSLVQLNVGVVDRQGRPITALSREDFAVYEDGVRQAIQHFEPTYAPFSLVMLLDISGSTSTFRQQLIFAATRFLDALGPDDRVSVIAFNAQVKTLIGFTNNREKVAYAITLASKGAGETHFYDALRFSLKDLEKEGRQRRKAIVVLTDGLDTEMRNSDRKVIANAQSDQEAIAAIKPDNQTLSNVLNEAARQGVTIYPLALPSGDPKRLPLPDPTITGIYSAARARLQSLADRTGGRLNEIHRLEQLAGLYREVAADLRTLYTVAYQAPGHARDGKWHEIRVEVARPELIARTRPGYYAK
jgi:Ca-activated chloride channel homolog